MKWNNKQISRVKLNPIAKRCNVSEMMVQILLYRGCTEQDIYNIYNDPTKLLLESEGLNNCIEAIKLLIEYLEDEKALIAIRSDYDTDGITSGYILGDGLLTVAKCEVIVSYPERKEGYGLQMAFCDELLEAVKDRKPSKTLLITVDNGIASYKEIAYLKENNITTLVIDHHEPKEILPDCLIIDPWKDEDITYRHLCGAGLALKVILALFKCYDIEDMAIKYYAIAAIGTIGDMMPITMDNMAICLYGMAILNDMDVCPQSIKAMKEYLGLDTIDFNTIGWDISPRLNACGRMGDTQLAGEYLYSDGFDYDYVLDELVYKIDKYNCDRKEQTNKQLLKAKDIINYDAPISIVVLNDCVEGLAGVIVNKIIELTNKPSIVFVDNHEGDYLVGSARTVGDIDILEILTTEKETNNTILKFGGHKEAAGITVERSKFEQFKKNLESLQLEQTVVNSNNETTLDIDSTITLSQVKMDLYEEISILPYDKYNFIEPVFELEATITNKYFTKAGDKMFVFITDYTMEDTDKNRYKELKLLVKDDIMNRINNFKSNKVRIACSIKKDFLNQFKTATIDIKDIEEC